jgi:hypothetical protein
MVSLIGCLIGFIGFGGFGMSTDLYVDFLGVSKKTNDEISFVSGLLFAIFYFYISYPIFH